MTDVQIKTIACGLGHSGCVLEDGSVFLWGIVNDFQQNKDFIEKCILKKPTKIQFKSVDPGSVSNRRRQSAVEESNSVYVEDLKLGEQFSIALSSKGVVYAWG